MEHIQYGMLFDGLSYDACAVSPESLASLIASANFSSNKHTLSRTVSSHVRNLERASVIAPLNVVIVMFFGSIRDFFAAPPDAFETLSRRCSISAIWAVCWVCASTLDWCNVAWADLTFINSVFSVDHWSKNQKQHQHQEQYEQQYSYLSFLRSL